MKEEDNKKLQKDAKVIDDIRKDLPINKQKLTTEQVIAMDQERIYAGSQGKQTFSPEDINLAMRDLDDWQQKSLLNVIVLGDVAKACKENKQAFVTEIEMALPITAITYEVKHLFEDTWKFTKTSFGYEYYFTPPIKWDVKIPVKIYVYHEKFKLFDSPDRAMYGVDGFYIPNPFTSYWQIRQLIKSKLEKGIPLSKDKLLA